MTFFAIPYNEKKSTNTPWAYVWPTRMVNGDAESVVYNRPQFSWLKMMLLFLMSVLVMMMGLLGGYALYLMAAPMRFNVHYRTICDVSYVNATNSPQPIPQPFDLEYNYQTYMFDEDLFENPTDDKYFHESIEMDDEYYANIGVPNFKGERRCSFYHDFKLNQTAIIDHLANRCFVMELDQENILSPKDFLNVMENNKRCYYNIETDRVRQTMHVITPSIKDFSQISRRIANECLKMNTYMLEKILSEIVKPETGPVATTSSRYCEFFGKCIIEIDLRNIDEIDQLERNIHK